MSARFGVLKMKICFRENGMLEDNPHNNPRGPGLAGPLQMCKTEGVLRGRPVNFSIIIIM